MRTSTLATSVLLSTLAATASAEPPKSAEAPPQSPAPGGTPPAATPRYEITGLSAPESVLYDVKADVYLVSNINGSQFKKDDNGFVTRIAPSGEIVTLKWIDGARPNVELNAPKGMAILGDRLYVADLDMLRTFDRTTGAQREAIKIPGATFLNDVAAGPASVYVSDTAINEDMGTAGEAAIYEVRDGKAKVVARGPDLAGPNGLATRGQELWAVTLLGNELYRVTGEGKRADVTKLPQGQLDGLLILADGTFLISSWQASVVYAGRPGSDFAIGIPDLPAPADIGFDSKRSRVLVPQLQKDMVAAFDWATPRTRFGRSATPDRARRP